MRCGYGLIHGTKHRKDNQLEKLTHKSESTKQNTQSSFDDRLRAPNSYGVIAFFRPDTKI